MYKHIIVDGNYLAFRNFYGLANFRYRGIDTGMTYGFINTLLSIKKLYGGKIHVAWDCGYKHRQELYADYKANRVKLSKTQKNKFDSQLSRTQDVLDMLGIEQVYKDGFEADDIIATLVKKLKGKKLILTKDKDMHQLITDEVHILKNKKKGYEVIDRDIFFDSYGFEPSDMLYALAITGDTSDNIPGVDGIGMKSVAKLLNKYGKDLRLFIEGKKTTNLQGAGKVLQNFEKVNKAYKLVQLKEVSDPIYRKGSFDKKATGEVFEYLGFSRFLKEKVFKEVLALRK